MNSLLQSAARSAIHRARRSWPRAVRALGLPEGVHATIDEWSPRTGESLVFVNAEPAREVIEIRSRHLPDRTHPAFERGAVFADLRTWLATMRDARVVDQHGYVVTAGNRVLGDVPKVYKAGYTAPAHPLLQSVSPPKIKHLSGTSAVLSIFSAGNYYHWMFEALPRLELIRRAGVALDSIDWFIVNETENQFVRPSLARLGVPEHKLQVSRDGAGFQCERLLVPSMPCQTNPSQWVCDFLREKFLPRETAPPARLFVSRAPGARRRIVNEAEVESLLTARGFRKIYLENVSLEEQVGLFASAEAVIGAHGASMANLVFCSPGTKAIEIFDPNYVNACYRGVAYRAGVDYGYLIGEGAFAGVVQDIAHCADDIHVDVSQLQELLGLCGL